MTTIDLKPDELEATRTALLKAVDRLDTQLQNQRMTPAALKEAVADRETSIAALAALPPKPKPAPKRKRASKASK